MSFQNLEIEVRYRSNRHNFPRDFLIPVLKETVLYKRAVGFFSTTALLDVSTGLFEMAKKGGRVQLICSPDLSEEDIQAIALGYKKRDEVIANSLMVGITNPINEFQEERLNLIATMIASGMLELKLAFLENESGISVYHEKITVFVDQDGNRISCVGSMNESGNAFHGNFESFFTFCSWNNETGQQAAIRETEDDFDEMWNNNTAKLCVVPFPQVVINKLLTYKRPNVDYTTDQREYNYLDYIKQHSHFQVPDGIELRAYQKEAVASWFNQECRGIFSMCTGSGKTFTALDCMVELAHRSDDRIAVFILCPYIHLVSQWEEDVVEWGFDPIIAHSKSTTPHWKDAIKRAYRRYSRNGEPFICITTNDTFSGPDIQRIIQKFSSEDTVLLIVDEAHNLGAESFAEILPENISFRIGLSATIRRYMDHSGTNRLFSYFGDECIKYDLEQALKDGALVPYEYYPIPVYLQEDELCEYNRISRQLKKHLEEDSKGRMKISESGKPLIYKRSRLLAGARNKISLLMECIEPYKHDQNILVYCGATTYQGEDDSVSCRQIELITEKLRNELKMSVKKFTADESLAERQNIKKYFQTGQYQAITALLCLDEGINIVGIQTAFILSSSRNPKQFIQRRGRLLRKSPGKEKAVIYDFVTLPRPLGEVIPDDFENDRTTVLGEIARINEFGKLAINSVDAHALMSRIMEAYDSFVDIEEYMTEMEDYYGE